MWIHIQRSLLREKFDLKLILLLMQKMKGSILRFHSFSTHLQKLGADSVGQIPAFPETKTKKVPELCFLSEISETKRLILRSLSSGGLF